MIDLQVTEWADIYGHTLFVGGCGWAVQLSEHDDEEIVQKTMAELHEYVIRTVH